MINIFKGLNTKTNPASAAFEPGYASVCDNCRIDDNMTWAQGPALVSASASLSTKSLGAGSHFKVMSLNGTRYIFTGIGDYMTCCEGSNGLIYYVTESTKPVTDTIYGYNGTSASAAGIARSNTYPTMEVSGTGTRMEDGIYYYMATIYDPIRDVESLPTYAVEHYVARRYEGDKRAADVPKITGPSSTDNKIRFYRSLRIPINKGDTVQKGFGTSATDFYFAGETNSGTAFYDYAHDSEIAKPENLYTGRGSPPPGNVNCVASFDNRLWAFVGEDVYWSSAGRPEEFPKAYTLTMRHDYSTGLWTTGTYKDKLTKNGSPTTTTLTLYPTLDTGIKGEARMKVPGLASSGILLAREWRGRLWCWTESSTYYIEKAGNIEGYRCVKYADGIGVNTPHVTDESPYGLFGGDSKSIWLLTDTIKRIGEDRIDSAFFNDGNYEGDCGVWVDNLKEYWYCNDNLGQLAYRADINAFVGPYDLSITGACSYTDNTKNQAYVTAAKTPTIASRSGAQSLKFWFGDPYSVKDNLKVEVIYLSNNTTVSAVVYQNNIASDTVGSGAKNSGTYSHTSANLTGMMEPRNSGRFFEITFSIPTTKIAPIAAINFKHDTVHFGERNRR